MNCFKCSAAMPGEAAFCPACGLTAEELHELRSRRLGPWLLVLGVSFAVQLLSYAAAALGYGVFAYGVAGGATLVAGAAAWPLCRWLDRSPLFWSFALMLPLVGLIFFAALGQEAFDQLIKEKPLGARRR